MSGMVLLPSSDENMLVEFSAEIFFSEELAPNFIVALYFSKRG